MEGEYPDTNVSSFHVLTGKSSAGLIKNVITLRLFSVGFGEGVYRFSRSDPGIGRVEDYEVSLHEDFAQKEVVSSSTWGSKVTNNQIKAVSSTTNKTVKATRPKLSVRSKFEWNLVFF